MPKVRLMGYRSERCDHEWLPRDKGQEPRVCPKCKSPYWNVKRGTNPRGRPRIVSDGQGVVIADQSIRLPGED